MKTMWKKTKDIYGTAFVDSININYKKLVDTFGKPHLSDGFKTDAEWGLEFPDGTVATIYNWKNGKNYLGDDGLETENITTWHIGGKNRLATLWAKLTLELIDKQKFIIQIFQVHP